MYLAEHRHTLDERRREAQGESMPNDIHTALTQLFARIEGFDDVSTTSMVIAAALDHSNSFAPADRRTIADLLKTAVIDLEAPPAEWAGEVLHDDATKRQFELRGAAVVAHAFDDAFKSLDTLTQMAPEQAERIIEKLHDAMAKLQKEN